MLFSYFCILYILGIFFQYCVLLVFKFLSTISKFALASLSLLCSEFWPLICELVTRVKTDLKKLSRERGLLREKKGGGGQEQKERESNKWKTPHLLL